MRGSTIGPQFDEVLFVPLPLARLLCAGLARCVLSVALDGKRGRLRGGITNFPRFSEIELLILAIPEDNIDHNHIGHPEGHKLLKFVRASSHLKMTKNVSKAAKAIIEACLPEQVTTDISVPNRLARHRIEYDMAMCLVMRIIFAWRMLFDVTMSLYLFVDGSPSSGYEAFVAHELMDSINTDGWSRLLPITFLGYGWIGLTAKVYALL